MKKNNYAFNFILIDIQTWADSGRILLQMHMFLFYIMVCISFTQEDQVGLRPGHPVDYGPKEEDC